MARAQQLPRGRHGLTREEVITSQQGRMLAAMADAVAERGYAKTSVSDVIRHERGLRAELVSAKIRLEGRAARLAGAERDHFLVVDGHLLAADRARPLAMRHQGRVGLRIFARFQPLQEFVDVVGHGGGLSRGLGKGQRTKATFESLIR